MGFELSNSDWDELWQTEGADPEAIAPSREVGAEQVYKFPEPLGWGSERILPLRDGLSLSIRDHTLRESVTLDSYYPPETCSDLLCISFVVSGTVRTIHHGLTDYIYEVAGTSYLEFVPEGRETEDWQAGDRIIKIRVELPMGTLQKMSRESSSVLPKELHLLIEQQSIAPFYRLETTTPEMQSILQQILNCPYHGWMRQLYLEGKVLELLILWLTFAAKQDHQAKPSVLRPGDIERVRQARELLIQHLDHPPSLLELARRVGLNDYKLKQGFRQLYGTTVFGYLHTQRMEKARDLLCTGHLKITEVAYTVGYTSLPSFSLAFRKRFGVSPKAYLA
jgi:AraC family transcriptional regulator, transcriptional activator of the genes for pyochelin and ferripyochelin receptors